MNWKTLFLSPDGRIGRKDFWIGTGLLVAANLLAGIVPVLGLLFHLASTYVWVCLSSKRLHDMGKSGWLTAAPYVVWAIALTLAAITGGAAIIAAIASGSDAATALGTMGLVGLMILVAILFGLAFLMWIGLGAPAVGDNRYGPPPAALVPGF